MNVMSWVLLIENLISGASAVIQTPAAQALLQQLQAVIAQWKANQPKKLKGAAGPEVMGDLIDLQTTDATAAQAAAAASAAAIAAEKAVDTTQTADAATLAAALATLASPVYQMNPADASVRVFVPEGYVLPANGIMTVLPPTTPIPTAAPAA